MSKIPSLEVRPTLARAADTDLVAVYQDGAKKAIPPKGPYSAVVQKLRKIDPAFARAGSAQFLRFGGKGGTQNALMMGLGPQGEVTEEKLRQAGGNAWQRVTAEKAKALAIRVDALAGARAQLAPGRAARALAEGLVLGAYQVKKRKAPKAGSSPDKADDAKWPEKITFVTKDKALQSELKTELARVAAEAEAVTLTRDWSNEPSNIGTPEFYAGEAQRLAKEYGLKCTILDEKEAAKEKMGLFLGVGQGAEQEGRMVILEYTPSGKADPDRKTVALVGKGVTFDSGGISIKPSMRMEDMKHDMTGAATVMGALMLASRWKIANRVIGVMAFTENMPSGHAIQPGNVLTSRSGKTVEVINTDAEGRLILADALDYVQDFKPDAVIDIATLTGAVSIALGKYCCGLMGNNDALIAAVKKAGEVHGERIWQLPLFDEYFEDLKSDYADMKNSANDSYGGTIRAAMFLKQFIRKGVAWAHLDIASTAYSVSHLSYFPKKGASGAYVRTLAQLAADFGRN